MKYWKRSTCFLIALGLTLGSMSGCKKGEKETEAYQNEQVIVKEQTPKFQKEDIISLVVEKENKVEYSLKYDMDENKMQFDYWDMEEPYQSYVVVDTEKMYEMYGTFAGIDWANAEKATSAKDTGIENSKTKICVEYVPTEENDPADHMMLYPNLEASKRIRFTVLVGNKNEDGKYYCAIEEQKDNVLLIDDYKIESVINRNPYDLILKIPYLVSINTVSCVEVEYMGKKLKMQNTDNVQCINDKKVEAKEYNQLYSQLLQPGVVEEVKETEKLDGEEIVSLTYVRNKKDLLDYHVSIYETKDGKEYITVNDLTFFYVDPEEVKQMLEVLSNY